MDAPKMPALSDDRTKDPQINPLERALVLLTNRPYVPELGAVVD